MKASALVGTFTALVFAANAWAMHCPQDMAKIDAALAKQPSLSKDEMSRVKQLRAEGEALHKAGKHNESVAKLAEAMKLLNIE